MIRPRLVLSALLLLSASVSAQSPQTAASSLVRPITGTVRDAGVYHFGLGTWTRHVDTANGITHDVVYANTCPTGYYASTLTNEYLADEGRVPGSHGPVLCDVGTLSTNAGCHCTYNVCGFQIGYCSGINGPGHAGGPGPVSVNIGFSGAYIACSVPSTLPGSPGTFTLTGLPGAGLPPGVQGCWLVTVDLEAASLSFQLPADGANCSWLPTDLPSSHLFGWTFQNLTLVSGVGQSYVGPFIAPLGSYPCSMVDGTRWDTLSCPMQGGGSAKWPNNLTEDGFGMDTQDRFRDDTTNVTGGPLSAPSGPGCYFFGGNPYCSFHLRLFSDAVCPAPAATDLCVPGVGGLVACPCSNPQVPAGSTRGCNNSANTGGALLSSSGTSSLTADTLQFISSGEPPNASSILLQGRIPASSHGIQFGQGVRCMMTGLVRLYLHNAVAGTVVFPQGSDVAVHAQSAAKGDVILAPATRLYAVYYRDPTVLGACSPSDTFNTSQTQSLVWVP